MRHQNFALMLAAVVFAVVLVCGNVLVRMRFSFGNIPDPYSFAVVLIPPFAVAVGAYKLALRRRSTSAV